MSANTDVYIMDSRSLYAISLDGTWRQVPGDWFGTNALARYEDRLLVLYKGELMEADPQSGAWRSVSSRWGESTNLLAVAGELILIVAGSRIYAADLQGEYKLLSADDKPISAITTLGERVFVLEGQRLQEFTPAGAGWRAVGDDWRQATALVGLGGKLYLGEQDGDIYEVDPDSGEHRLISRGWPMFLGLIAAGDQLLLLSGTTVYTLSPEGDYAALSQGWRHIGVYAPQT